MKLPRLSRLSSYFASKDATTNAAEWRVELLDPRMTRDRARIRWLSLRPDYRVLDTLATQLEDLVATTHPGKKLAGPDLERALDRARGGRPLEECGAYVHYAWKKELVRVLDREDFVRLRTNRNCHKITLQEQAILGRKTIAVAGLSVGLAVVTTLALERVGARFHLADFDDLALTNLNRLLAGVSEIGLPKTVIAARRLFELDPYLDITLFSEGVTPANTEAFLDGVDLLVEECDDLAAKLYLREHARARRIPVLMQTSEGGLLDVERFDLDPERPVLHGLVGDLTAEHLSTLGRRHKVPVVARIVDDGLSARGAASMLEIETTLSTWPQLGSSVVAGAGAAVDVARRMLLGQFEESGRYVFDAATGVLPGTQRYARPVEPAETKRSGPGGEPPSRRPSLPVSSPAAPEPVTKEQIETLVALATLAPSGGNVQPWRFEWSAPRLTLQLDASRGGGVLNYDDFANAIALGAAAESVVLAATSLGRCVEPLAMGTGERSFASVAFDFGTGSRAELDPLAERLALRCTNRGHGASAPLTPAEASTVRGRLSAEQLLILDTPEQLQDLGEVLAEGDQFRILHPALHAEMMGELRLPEALEHTLDDGIETSTMDMDGADLAVLRLWSRPSVVAQLRSMGLGGGIHELARKRTKHSSAALVLRTRERSFDSFFLAGRELLRLWLRAESAGLAVHPWGALGYFVQHEENDPERARREGLELGALGTRYRKVVPRHEGGEALLLFLHRAPSPAAMSRRRAVDEVLSVVASRLASHDHADAELPQ